MTQLQVSLQIYATSVMQLYSELFELEHERFGTLTELLVTHQIE